MGRDERRQGEETSLEGVNQILDGSQGEPDRQDGEQASDQDQAKLSRRSFLKGAAGLFFSIATGAGLREKAKGQYYSRTVKCEPDEPLDYGEDIDLIVPGSHRLDLDSGRLATDTQDYRHHLDRTKTELTFDFCDLRFSDSGHYWDQAGQPDVWWHAVNEDYKLLEAKNGAHIAYFGQADFDDLTEWDLRWANYNRRELTGGACDSELEAGDVFAVRTSKGNYAKLRVMGYEPLLSEWHNDTDHHLELEMELFPGR